MMHGDTAARMTPQAFQALIDEALPLCALYAGAAIVLWLIPTPVSEPLPGVERLRRRHCGQPRTQHR